MTIKRKIRYILFCIVLVVILTSLPNKPSLAITEKGSPIINNYLSREYRANSQNWGIAEDSRGIMYFANLDGVLEFDGESWNLIRLPDNKPASYITSDDKGTIYVGSHSEFGYLEPNQNGQLTYKSLLYLFPEEKRDFPFTRKIVCSSQGVFFSNRYNIYQIVDSTVRRWDIPNYRSLFNIGNTTYVFNRDSEIGLMYFDGDDFVVIDQDNPLAGYAINGLYPYSDDKLLVSSRYRGLLLINDILNNTTRKNLEPRPLTSKEITSILDNNRLLHGIKLKNGNYAFATSSKGVFIIDNEGNLIRTIQQNTGLQNETVNYLYENDSQILWMALENGISSANINYPLTYWDNSAGFEGAISDIAIFNDKIYIATWQGVYVMRGNTGKSSANARFEKIDNISDRANTFLIIKDNFGEEEKLIVATNEGVYSISGIYSDLIKEGVFFSLTQPSNTPGIILCGGSNGLFLLHYNHVNKNITPLQSITELDRHRIFEVKEEKPGLFWLTNRYKSISAIEFHNLDGYTGNDQDLSYNVFHFDDKNGIPSQKYLRPVKLKEKTFFYSSSSIYVFNNINPADPGEGLFKPVSPLVNNYLENNISFSKLKLDKYDNLWVQFHSKTSRERTLFLVEDFINNLMISDYSLIPIKQTGINKVLSEDNNHVSWLGGDDALFRLELKALDHKIPAKIPYIRNIKVNNRPIYFGANNNFTINVLRQDDLDDILQNIISKKFAYTDKYFTFEYAYPSFFDPAANLYSVFLKNYDTSWSDWTHETNKTYNNLPPGNYLFLVRSMDPFGNKSIMTGFAFSILNPWYKSQTAYIIYILVFILIIYLIIFFTNRQLVKAKINLEKQVKERTSEIASQRKKLEIEKEKSDKLLQNILPFKIAQELKMHGNVRAQYYDIATVMFMDFKDFSKISQYINPLHLINELDKSFGYFDEVCTNHNLEKIKTMGDAYMCAGGIPQPNKTNPFDALLAAFEIIEFIKKAEKDQWLCELRIGIHSGELIAGVVSKNKFAYDIWGETVNTASRLESTGEVNKINISGETYNIIKDYFVCTYRGRLPAKHSDEYQMYFVNRIKKEYSADNAGKVPNKKFIDIINKMK